MAYQARFVADFTEWDRTIANATENVRAFEVTTKNAQARLQRMVSAFDGTKVMKEASLAVAAIQKIGSAEKLTETELRRANSTLTEGLAKYRALGQEAPAALQKTAGEVRGLVNALDAQKRAQQELEREQARAKGETEAHSVSFGKLVASYVTAQGVWSLATGLVRGVADAFVDAATSTIALGDKLSNMSASTGMSVEGLQKLQYATAASGVSLDTLSNASLELGRRLAEGDKSAVGAIKRLGISLADFQAMGADEQILAVNEALRGMGTQAERNAISADLFGKAWKTLAPALQADLKGLGDEAARMGIVLDQVTVDAIDNFGDMLDAAGVAASGIKARFFVPLLEEWAKLNGAMDLSAINLGDWAETAGRVFVNLARDLAQARSSAEAAFAIGAALGGGSWTKAFDETQRAKVDRARQAFADLGEEMKGLMHSSKGLPLPPPVDEKAVNAAAAAAKRFADEQDKWFGRDVLVRADRAIKQIGSLANVTRLPLQQQKALASVMAESADILDRNGRGASALAATYSQWSLAASQVRSVLLYQLVPGLQRTDEEMEQLETTTRAYIKATRDFSQNRDLQQLFPALGSTIRFASVQTSSWRRELAGLVQGFNQLSQAAGPGVLGRFAHDAGLVVSSFSLATEGVADFRRGVSQLGMGQEKKGLATIAQGSTQVATALLQASQATNIWMAGFAGAAAGFAAGGAVGAALGFAYAAITAYGTLLDQEVQALLAFEQRYANVMTRAQAAGQGERFRYPGRDTPSGLDEFAPGATALAIALRQTGLSQAEIDRLFDRRDIEAMARALDELDAKLQRVFSYAQRGQVLSRGQLELLGRLVPGTPQAEALGQFFEQQTKLAAEGIGGWILARQKLIDALKAENLGADEIEKLNKQLALMPLNTANAEAFGAALLGIFADLQLQGATPLEALAQLGPSITSLQDQLAQAGLGGGEAFAELGRLAATAAGEFGPALQAVAGLGQGLAALQNTGLLTQSMFEGLAGTVAQTFSAMVAQGASGEDALRLMQPTLQQIWQLQTDFGYAVDEATQKLIDEAEAAGLVGDKFRPAADRMAAAIERLVERLDVMLDRLGVQLPRAAATGAAGLTTALSHWRVPTIHVPYDFVPTGPTPGPIPRPTPVPALPPGAPSPGDPGFLQWWEDYYRSIGRFPWKPFARGGPVYAATGGGFWRPQGTDTVPAMLTPGEFVISRPAATRAGTDVLQAINRGEAPARAVNVSLNVDVRALDGSDVEAVLLRRVVPTLRRLIRADAEHIGTGLRTDLRVPA